MAILEEANLLAERARHAKHRTHHVGTKLNGKRGVCTVGGGDLSL